jgi:L-rhamnose-H+ transport protein
MGRTGNFALGILFGVTAGLVNGVFLLPMRYTRKWAWENTWLIFTVFSTFLFPWIAALMVVPHLLDVLRSSPVSDLIPGLVAGSVWGIAQVLYGLGCGMVGIAIGSAVIGCTAILAGTLGPMLVYAPGELLSLSSLVLLLGAALIVLGIASYGTAGARREKETAGAETRQVVKGSFRTGLIVCLVSGVVGTAFIYGGKSSTGLLEHARSAGAAPMFAFYAAYLVTFNAGMIPGMIYALYKLNRNHTGSNYFGSGASLWNLAMAAAMALFWYGGLLCYGMSSEQMGRMGASIAFALFSSGTILSANFLWMVGGRVEGC